MYVRVYGSWWTSIDLLLDFIYLFIFSRNFQQGWLVDGRQWTQSPCRTTLHVMRSLSI
ncbi:hypothetical protein BDV06DRAFT_189863 [Aspergillus oleicola]